MKKLIFAGCSFTAGTGWNQDDPYLDNKDEPLMWTNLCHQNIKRFQNLEIINIGKKGASNTEIFENSVRLIADKESDIDIMFCQWTSVPRYNFNVGFELWDTSENSIAHNDGSPRRTHDVRLNRGDHWSRKYIDDLLDRFRVLHHLHWEIVKIVDYSNMLSALAEQRGFDIFFINGLCPWDENYFLELHDVKPDSYTEFTKKTILNIDSRDDDDIHKLYHLAHKHYRQSGGIDHHRWINLYNSFRSLQVDRNFDGRHPGKHSNQIYYELIREKFKTI